MPPKRRRKFHGLYFHSSPPKVLPMNGNIPNGGIKPIGREDGFVCKPSNIRIWIHQRDIGNLTRVLWAGEGHRLKAQSTTNLKVKRFLENVPAVMNTIKNVHQAVIDNNMELLENLLDEPPPSLVTTKDKNGLTVMHKAAGLGHTWIVEYLLRIWPQSAMEIDSTGKTPLHWAASLKNNQRIYNLLVQAGADEEALDYRMKTAAHYAKKPSDIERSFLMVVPDAPRIPNNNKPDWSLLVDNVGSLTGSKLNSIATSRRGSDVIGNGLNLLTTRSRINSIENISEPDYYDGGEEKENEEPQVNDEIIMNGNLENDNILQEPPESPSPDDSEIAPQAPETEEDTPETGEDEIDNIQDNEETDKVDENNNEPNEDENKEENTENGEVNETGNLEETQDKESNQENDNEDATENNKEEEPLEDNKEDEPAEENEINDDNEKNDENNNEEDLDTQNNEANETNNTEGPDENIENNVNEDSKSDTEEPEPENVNDANANEEENEDEAKEENEEENNEENEDKDKEETKDENNEENVEENVEDSKDNEENEEDTKDKEENGEDNKDKEDNDEDDDDQGIIQFENEDSTMEQNSSPSLEMAIEGLVQGEPDDNQVQSQSSEYVDEDSKIQTVIKTGDMEQLAQLVLNGEGNKIVNQKSDQAEIQAFLDNVPIYMNKIKRVHQAAKDGNIRDLQTALDRRKFAIAKDEISPNGASPLHVAVIFGHAGILRYLAGRFPETTQAVDENGRTALHYAAKLNDNGHFYNLLTQLGGNPKLIDKLGNTPEFYLKEQSNNSFNHKELLRIFGASEKLGEEMLSDQVEKTLDLPIFQTEQGQYLASSKWLNFLDLKKPLNLPSALGDPLVKGLTEIAEKRPLDPIAYLADFLQNYIKQRDNTVNNNLQEPRALTNGGVPFEQMIVPTHIEARAQQQTALVSEKQEEDERLPTPDGQESTPKVEDRDEHGQSMLHFACARSHGRNALINLIDETHIDITYRDELYRTARDVSLQASQLANAKEIDRFVIRLAANGDIEEFQQMLYSGYDHILDVTDESNNTIFDVVKSRGHTDLVKFLEDLRNFEEQREELHQAIRVTNLDKVKELLSGPNATVLIKAKNYYGRNALHIAILRENEDFVEMFSINCPEALQIGDNLERTPLHYAMGVNAVESISRILIRKGAKRTAKDLKGRQPSYYFMNKSDILRLQEEEDEDER